jgi:hypothetical protein
MLTAMCSYLLSACGTSTTRGIGGGSPQCSLGRQLHEGHQLLAPRLGTFYSVDALNPNVVAFDRHYLMYFSGNDRHTAEGEWREGLAIGSSPNGPFHVVANVKGNYLNGGTAVWHRRLWHVVEDNSTIGTYLRSELASSGDGLHWHRESILPSFILNHTAYHGADFYLEPQGSHLGVYMLAVPPGGGIGRSLAFASYANGRWSNFNIILKPDTATALHWASADLGEPATFYVGHAHYLLFVGLAQDDKRTRSIGLARDTATGWVVCRNAPATPNGAPWGPASSIDPSPLVVGKRLYLYYGATRTAGLVANLGGSIGVRVFTER